MAVKVLNRTEITKVNTLVEDVAFQDIDATDGAEFSFNQRDERILIGIKNKHVETAKTATIKAGNSVQSAFGDLSLSVGAGDIYWAQIDSGRFKNVSGTNKGKVKITGTDANIQVCVIRLP